MERKGLDKWLFNYRVAQRFEQLRSQIELIPERKYRRLLSLGLIAATTRVSNAKADGKCWRYKSAWRLRNYDADDVDGGFAEVIADYIVDIARLPRLAGTVEVVLDDSRVWLSRRAREKAGTVHVILTSPPYLNSFDYTDIYRPECFLLGKASTALDLRTVRLKTLRSHVQVEWPQASPCTLGEVKTLVSRLSRRKLWDRRIPSMVNAYFVDLEDVITSCRALLPRGGVLGMVVASSAYSGVVVPVPEIVAELMQRSGLDAVVKPLRVTTGNGHHQNRSGKALVECMVLGRVA